MDNTSIASQVLDNLSLVLAGIRAEPGLSEVFQSPIAPRLILDTLRNANPDASTSTGNIDPAELRGTAVNTSESGLRAMEKVLENDLILELIFSHCPFASLKECRRVCRHWRRLSLKAWRKEAVLVIVDDYAGKSANCMPLSKLNPILEEIRADGDGADRLQLLKKPFKSYRFVGRRAAGRLLGDSFAYSIEQFNCHATQLNLKGRLTMDDVKDGVFTKFRNLNRLMIYDINSEGPYLENLFADVMPQRNLKVLELRNSTVGRQFPWADFFRNMPNVQRMTLGFGWKPSMEIKSTKLLREALEGVRTVQGESAENLKLTEFDILEYHSRPIANFDYEVRSLMGQCNFPLERFSVDLGKKTNLRKIEDLLEPLSPTLKFLQATRGRNEELQKRVTQKDVREMLKKMWGPIHLEKLEELRCVNGPDWAFQLLACLEAPLLQKLVFETDLGLVKVEGLCATRKQVKYFHEAQLVRPFLRHKIFSKLQSFEYEHEWNLLGSKDLQALAAAMPHLKHLAIPLSAETFQDVCRLWPGLKSLEVRKCEGDFPEVDDEAVTGFTGLKVDSTLPPNITDLKELTDLIISCERTLKRREVKFTDHSVYQGFLKLPRLHYLSIAFKQISEKAKTALESHIDYIHYQSLEK